MSEVKIIRVFGIINPNRNKNSKTGLFGMAVIDGPTN
jgi:hypothetical protein